MKLVNKDIRENVWHPVISQIWNHVDVQAWLEINLRLREEVRKVVAWPLEYNDGDLLCQ